MACVVQLVEYLLGKRAALNSNSSPTKKNKHTRPIVGTISNSHNTTESQSNIQMETLGLGWS
jgi:hypothetical protein